MVTWVNYETQNYCSICVIVYEKDILRCLDCNKMLRMKPRKKYRTKEERQAHSMILTMTNS
jgi:hypothetical protein